MSTTPLVPDPPEFSPTGLQIEDGRIDGLHRLPIAALRTARDELRRALRQLEAELRRRKRK